MGSHYYIAKSGRGLGADATAKILTAKFQKRPIREKFNPQKFLAIQYFLVQSRANGSLYDCLARWYCTEVCWCASLVDVACLKVLGHALRMRTKYITSCTRPLV